VVERCFHALDTQRIEFHDSEQRCTVASGGAAAVPALVGICLLSQPELVMGAVVVIGVVMVAAAIQEELDAYELERERRRECTPEPVPHRGGDELHDTCADRVPQNEFPGSDVLVSRKNFDALQLHARVLWEVKTDNFDTYSVYLQKTVVDKQVLELRRERAIALACGFDFRIGVRSPSHKAALERAAQELRGIIVVMEWC
jgi:hypothetical protein